MNTNISHHSLNHRVPSIPGCFAEKVTGLLAGVSAASLVAIAPLAPAIAQTPAQPTDLPTLQPDNNPALVAPQFNSPPSSTAPLANPQVEDDYTLGVGDQIQIEVFDVPEVSEEPYEVFVDGSITLPWIGKVFVQGLTTEEAARTLTTAYASYIRDPLIIVNVLAPRPLRIGVVGEVNRPGSYTLEPNTVTTAVVEESSNTVQWPNVTDAIRAAGGITQSANIREVQIRREEAPGSESVIDINLWNLLEDGNLNHNVSLRDGDTIVIPTATALAPEEVAQLSSANFSPSTITVNVVGEVKSPGALEVQPNITLNQAILAAGGFNSPRSRDGSVELVRLNPNGTVARRTVPVDFSDGINEETNPTLQEGDIVVVERSNVARASDFIGILLSPVTGVLRLLDIF